MSTGGSKKVVILSLIANSAIALSKLAGALFTNSSALLAESIHSFADCGNQVLLLYGEKAANKRASKRFPLGHGKEAFFWSFIVAVLLFTMGGIFSLNEGLHKILHPEPVENQLVGMAILLMAIVFESIPFMACLKQIRKEKRFDGIKEWMNNTTSTDLLVIFLEDFAAILGSFIACVFLMLSWIYGNSLWDGIGSIVIAVLLIVVAIKLATEIKSLLIGEAPIFDYQLAVEKLASEVTPSLKVLKLIAVQVGINQIMVAYKIHPGNLDKTKDLIKAINVLEKKVKEVFPEIKWQFVEPDYHD